MNIYDLIITILLIFALIYTGLKYNHINKSVKWLSFGFVVALLIIIVNGFVYRIPNPLSLKPYSDDLIDRESIKIKPFVIPKTNADPNDAAKREFEVLDEAKRQQKLP